MASVSPRPPDPVLRGPPCRLSRSFLQPELVFDPARAGCSRRAALFIISFSTTRSRQRRLPPSSAAPRCRASTAPSTSSRSTEVVVRTRNFGHALRPQLQGGRLWSRRGRSWSRPPIPRCNATSTRSTPRSPKPRSARRSGPASADDLKNQEIEVDKLKKLLDANDISPVEYEKAQNLPRQPARRGAEGDARPQHRRRERRALARCAQRPARPRRHRRAHGRASSSTATAISANIVPPQTQICRIGSAENQVVAQVNEEDVGYLLARHEGENPALFAAGPRPRRHAEENPAPGGEPGLPASSSAWIIRPRCCCPA